MPTQRELLGCHAGHQEVSRSHTRGESQGMYNVEETSSELQNRVISGNLKRTYVLQKNLRKK